MVEISRFDEAFLAEGSQASKLFERACTVMPGGNSRTTVYQAPYPPYAAEGRGAIIVDVDGQERYDFLNNYTSLIHGHADPDITAAVIAEIPRGLAFAMPTEHEVRLAELLTSRVPSVEQIRFTNSGSEAVMIAIKAARAYTGRGKIMKFEGSYHGSYDFAEVSMTPPADTWEMDEPPSLAYSAGTPDGVLGNVIVSRLNDLALTERLIERNWRDLAAVLIDPMPMRAGLIPADLPFLNALREMTRERGIVLIFDEVIALRNAAGGTQSLLGITPDLTTMGKIIGGGMPVGAVGGSAEVMSVFDPRQGHPKAPHGGTFNANPMTMVAGLAAMQKMTAAEYERLAALGAQLREALAEAMDGARIHGQVTGGGSLFQIHLHDRPIRDYRGSVPTPDERERGARLHRGLMAHGIITAPSLMGCLSTPMGEAEVNAFVDAFVAAATED